MCLGIPGKVIEIYQQQEMKMGKVDFGGVVKEACLEFLPDIQIGDYTIIHVGFGISQLDEQERSAPWRCCVKWKCWLMSCLNWMMGCQHEIPG
jgi:hydrogenase assembly chaperone HypC/HupF